MIKTERKIDQISDQMIKDFYTFIDRSDFSHTLKKEKRSFDYIASALLKYFYHHMSDNKGYFFFDELIINSFATHLKERIYELLKQTAIVYINESRLNNNLVGTDKYQQYKYFIQNFYEGKKIYKDFFKEYPLLLERILIFIHNELLFIKWLSEKLLDDKEMLLNCFEFNIEHLVETVSVGDIHNQSKRTLILKDSEGKKIIFKPVPFKNSNIYHSLIENYNHHLEGVNIYNPKIVDREGYGYVEFISDTECSNVEDIQKYYYQTGVVLFISFMLNGNDLHNENIIASESSPIIIDFETLAGNIEFNENISFGDSILKKSVMNSRMLPVRFSKENAINDFSGIGVLMKKREKVISLRNEFTSQITETIQYKLSDDLTSHLPKVNGEIFTFDNYKEDILSGFKDAYIFALKNKENILSIIQRTANDFYYRKVYRNTATYKSLLERMNAPDLMKSKEYTKQYLLGLLRKDQHGNFSIEHLESEIQQLIEGAIPYFLKHNLIKDENNVLDITRKIQMLTYSDFLLQIKLMSISLLSNEEKIILNQDNLVGIHKFNIKRVNYQSIKQKVEQTILDSMYVSDSDEANFIALKVNWQGHLEVNTLNSGIYDGSLGLALTLNNNMNKEYINSIEQQSIVNILYQNYNNVGYINGISSFITYHLSNPKSTNINIRFLLNILSDIEKRIINNEYKEYVYDYIGGTAGLIVAISALYSKYPKYKKLIKIIERLGDYLIENIKEESGFSYWHSYGHLKLEDSIKGLAHGTTGYLLALVILKNVLETNKYDFWISKLKNDEKRAIDLYKYTNSWCKGYVGLGMSRLKMSSYQEEKGPILEELNLYKDYVIEGLGTEVDYNLCHGLMGSYDFLFELKRNQLLKNNEKDRMDKSIDNYFRNLDLSNYNSHKIGLFTGLSSILYFLTRLENTEQPTII